MQLRWGLFANCNSRMFYMYHVHQFFFDASSSFSHTLLKSGMVLWKVELCFCLNETTIFLQVVKMLLFGLKLWVLASEINFTASVLRDGIPENQISNQYTRDWLRTDWSIGGCLS